MRAINTMNSTWPELFVLAAPRARPSTAACTISPIVAENERVFTVPRACFTLSFAKCRLESFNFDFPFDVEEIDNGSLSLLADIDVERSPFSSSSSNARELARPCA
eukprot:263488_1